jgi:sporulation protein YlmC with PRC-barrel domain
MKRLIVVPLAMLVVVLLTGLSFAADMNAKGTMSTEKVTTFTGNQLHGLAVVNEDGKVIGEIKNINIDPNTGALRSVTFKRNDQAHYGVAPAWENERNTNYSDIGSPSPSPEAGNIEIGGGGSGGM